MSQYREPSPAEALIQRVHQWKCLRDQHPAGTASLVALVFSTSPRQRGLRAINRCLCEA